MGDVIDFTARRLKEPRHVTFDTVTMLAIDSLLQDWEKMARSNRLNDYFKRSLPNLIDAQSSVNFMVDLNGVAALELNLGLMPIILFPGTGERRQLGWVVRFKLGEHSVNTPELASEAYARCFAVLLYLKVKRAALEAGLL